MVCDCVQSGGAVVVIPLRSTTWDDGSNRLQVTRAKASGSAMRRLPCTSTFPAGKLKRGIVSPSLPAPNQPRILPFQAWEGPAAPAAPAAPAGPVGPRSPGAPAGPGASSAPAGPVAPVTPRAPAGPVWFQSRATSLDRQLSVEESITRRLPAFFW